VRTSRTTVTARCFAAISLLLIACVAAEELPECSDLEVPAPAGWRHTCTTTSRSGVESSLFRTERGDPIRRVTERGSERGSERWMVADEILVLARRTDNGELERIRRILAGRDFDHPWQRDALEGVAVEWRDPSVTRGRSWRVLQLVFPRAEEAAGELPREARILWAVPALLRAIGSQKSLTTDANWLLPLDTAVNRPIRNPPEFVWEYLDWIEAPEGLATAEALEERNNTLVAIIDDGFHLPSGHEECFDYSIERSCGAPDCDECVGELCTGPGPSKQTHGSHTASLIAATRQQPPCTIASAGGGYVTLLPIRTSAASGLAFQAQDATLEAVELAVEKKARIVVTPWGGDCRPPALGAKLDDLAESKRMLFVASAGNERLDLSNNDHWPATHSGDNVLSVGATVNEQRSHWEDSNHGAPVDLWAPGDAQVPWDQSAIATSWAVSLVGGAAALTAYVKSNLTGPQLRCLLINTANQTAEGAPFLSVKNATNQAVTEIRAAGLLDCEPRQTEETLCEVEEPTG
jgi:hypothetical protein